MFVVHALTRRTPSDTWTPVTLAHALRAYRPVLLESAEGESAVGRHSYVALGRLAEVLFFPDGSFRVLPEEAGTAFSPSRDPEGREGAPFRGRPLAEGLSAFSRLFRLTDEAELPSGRFRGGFLFAASFELAHVLGREGGVLPPARRAPADASAPLLYLVLPEVLLTFDHRRGTLEWTSFVLFREGADAEERRAKEAEARKRLERLWEASADARLPLALLEEAGDEADAVPDALVGEEEEAFLRRVEGVLAAVRKGEVEQVVLSHRMEIPLSELVLPAGDERDLASAGRPRERAFEAAFLAYRALRHVNPSPYMYFFPVPRDLPRRESPSPSQNAFESGEDFAALLVGSSPEVLFRIERDGVGGEGARRVLVRPIAGTRRRGRTPEEDLRMREELLADAKEREEHEQLVRLTFADLAPLVAPGSLALAAGGVLETYSHVIHLVSQVEGHLLPDVGAWDVFARLFPAGTVLGAPRARALELLAEEEGSPRGFYGGAVGFVGFDGEADAAIAIRTLVFRGDVVEAQAGAGIVAGSLPAREALEIRNKRRVLLTALGVVRSAMRRPAPRV
ncbi:anthranilate synthase component I family protein [Brockia lithotrophica]|uniref:Anthranilate synthase component 1 n=1 Tax=Brockia lithotrophica TaxID=933949 RepID=A0A660L6R6_9BACL|nr:anthranilate synthase component I family protein [Brockia lithotrophica]RKQ89025.1 anthranilate synthase component 1 [Brockia lithotrophica]